MDAFLKSIWIFNIYSPTHEPPLLFRETNSACKTLHCEKCVLDKEFGCTIKFLFIFLCLREEGGGRKEIDHFGMMNQQQVIIILRTAKGGSIENETKANE